MNSLLIKKYCYFLGFLGSLGTKAVSLNVLFVLISYSNHITSNQYLTVFCFVLLLLQYCIGFRFFYLKNILHQIIFQAPQNLNLSLRENILSSSNPSCKQRKQHTRISVKRHSFFKCFEMSCEWQ